MSSDEDSESDAERRATGEKNPAINADNWPNEDPDVMRIMLSTDNHLGYAERDVVRGMDSFAAFEEVLYLAKKFNCDMVLIAGDLFHDNRPSRGTLHRTMEILRRYCMGPEAVKIEFLSDAAAQLQSAVTVNYQDANYAVGLPLFSIHGNHDDPSRDQGGGDLLAALDLLAISNLVNYFGRQDQVDKVEISPLLLQKGSTKVALFGLGSLRDERLNRMWEQKKVRFLRPEMDDDGDDVDDVDEDSFFNIFTLHQNRDLGRGSKNCVQESMIPDWMDLVVWGHEHECLIEFAESVVGTFRITQPGSSVATSLVSGEAQKKQIGILDIRGKSFRLHPVPLTQVRSFVTTELSLREHRAELDPEDPKIDSKVSSVLEDEVRYMANSARKKMESILKEARQAGNDAGEDGSSLTYKLQKPNEVLVRIRVEHNGFTTLNNQRFGAKFVGDVANPSDMLLFHRKKDPKLASKIKKKKIEAMAPEQIEQTNMEDLIKQQLESGDSKLQVYPQDSLSEAMEEYVEKSLTAAISETAVGILSQKTKTLIAMNKANNDDDDDDQKLEKGSQVLDALNRESQSQEDVSMVEAGDDEEEQPSKKSKAKGSKKRKGTSTQEKENSMELDDSLEEPKSRSKKGATKKKKKSPLDSDDDDDDDDSFQAPKARGRKAVAKKAALDSDDDDDSFGPAKSRGKKTSALKNDDDDSFGAPPAKRAPAAKKSRAAPRRKNNDFSDSEELSDVDVVEVVKAAPKARSKPATRAKRSSAKKPVKYAFASDDDDEEEEDAIIGSDEDDEDLVEVEPPSKRKKAASGRALSGTARAKKKKETINRKAQFGDSDDDVVCMGSSQNNNDNLEDDWASNVTKSQY